MADSRGVSPGRRPTSISRAASTRAGRRARARAASGSSTSHGRIPAAGHQPSACVISFPGPAARGAADRVRYDADLPLRRVTAKVDVRYAFGFGRRVEQRVLLEAENTRGDVCREAAAGGVVFLDALVVPHPLDGNPILRAR